MAHAARIDDELLRSWILIACQLIAERLDPHLGESILCAILQSETSDQIGRTLADPVCGASRILEGARKVAAAEKSLVNARDVALLYEAVLAAQAERGVAREPQP